MVDVSITATCTDSFVAFSEEPGAIPGGGIVAMSLASPREREILSCAGGNQCILFVVNIPAEDFKPLRHRLTSGDGGPDSDGTPANDWLWRLKFSLMPETVAEKLLNRPHAVVSEWRDAKSWIQQNKTLALVTDGDLLPLSGEAV
jgi:hypothetical protein